MIGKNGKLRYNGAPCFLVGHSHNGFDNCYHMYNPKRKMDNRNECCDMVKAYVL